MPAMRLPTLFATATAVLLQACGGGGAAPATPAAPASSATAGPPSVVTFATGLAQPWGLAFLPDGSALVTERGGSLRRVSADGRTVSAPLAGVPTVHAQGQGGLLDVALDPDFAADPWVYLSYSEPGSGAEAGRSGTAVARGRLQADRLADVQVIFRQTPKMNGSGHYGARLVFGADKTLWVALGERQADDPANPGLLYAQNNATHLGKVVRIARDGSVPAGNPALGAGALPQLYSTGHRNPQGAAQHPDTGALWLVEHGPQGGDELNLVRPGANHGWPLRSYGCPYGSPVGEACRVGGGLHAPAYAEPATTWVPTSTAPSGLVFYTGSRFPEWRGNAFTGALAGQVLWRLQLQGEQVVAREALFASLGERIRDVRQGPDGWLYLLTDSAQGRILRVQR